MHRGIYVFLLMILSRYALRRPISFLLHFSHSFSCKKCTFGIVKRSHWRQIWKSPKSGLDVEILQYLTYHDAFMPIQEVPVPSISEILLFKNSKYEICRTSATWKISCFMSHGRQENGGVLHHSLTPRIITTDTNKKIWTISYIKELSKKK